jgi:acyl-CoA reductase-like NAD-dependent aldehyde dehydrogenase
MSPEDNTVLSPNGAIVSRIRQGSPLDFRNFMGAVIDEQAFNTIMSYIDGPVMGDPHSRTDKTTRQLG